MSNLIKILLTVWCKLKKYPKWTNIKLAPFFFTDRCCQYFKIQSSDVDMDVEPLLLHESPLMEANGGGENEVCGFESTTCCVFTFPGDVASIRPVKRLSAFCKIKSRAGRSHLTWQDRQKLPKVLPRLLTDGLFGGRGGFSVVWKSKMPAVTPQLGKLACPPLFTIPARLVIRSPGLVSSC